MNEGEFLALCGRPEGENIDFKQCLQLEKDKQADFVKDIVSMANTPRSECSYIVIGVKKHKNQTFDLIGMENHPDDADLHQILSDKVAPMPRFYYYVVRCLDKEFGVIEIPPEKIGPCVPIRTYGNSLSKNQVYYRAGSRNEPADPSQMERIISWVRSSGAVELDPLYPTLGDEWQRFFELCSSFESEGQYCLIAPKFGKDRAELLSHIGSAPWSFVVDFDPRSDVDGLLKVAKPSVEVTRAVHIAICGEDVAHNPGRSVVWWFARGLEGRDPPIDEADFKGWRGQKAPELLKQFQTYARAVNLYPTTVVVIWEESLGSNYLDVALSTLRLALPDVQIVIAATSTITDASLTLRHDAEFVEIRLDDLAAGFRSHFHIQATECETVEIPGQGGARRPVPQSDLVWLSEELEVIHSAAGIRAVERDPYGEQFFRGGVASWYHLAIGMDVARAAARRVKKQLELDLSARRTSRVYLYHTPGAGGTTLARRVSWDIHRDYPVVRLLSVNPLATAGRVEKIYSIAGKPVLILADGSEIAPGEADELYHVLSARQIPSVILQVQRSLGAPRAGARVFLLPLGLDDTESWSMANALTNIRPEKRGALEDLAENGGSHERNAFIFGLTAFEREFRGIRSYVTARISLLSVVQRELLAAIALCYHYGHRGIPAQVFAGLLCVEDRQLMHLRPHLPERVFDLLLQDTDGRWRVVHDIVAEEILCSCLIPEGADPRTWKQYIADFSKRVISSMRGRQPIPSDDVVDVVKRVFALRENSDSAGSSNVFSQIIEDIPSDEGAAELLLHVAQTFPDQAHFWAHLGRFYSRRLKDFDQAVKHIKKALDISDKDGLLWHMLGMAYRQKMKDRIEAKNSVQDIVNYAKSACEAFAEARKLKPDDEHGYISEIQLSIELLRYIVPHDADFSAVMLSPDIDPWVQERLQEAEALLDHVWRSRERGLKSSFAEQCRADLDAFYGRHDKSLETLGNLLSRREAYKPPIRRQIIQVLLSRSGRNWDKIEPGALARIVELAELNLREESNRDNDIRIWLNAVRHISNPPSIDSIIERLTYWRSNSNSLDSIYYLFVLHALKAMDGATGSYERSIELLEECRGRSRLNRHRTTSFEWLGHGSGITRLVHHSRLGDWDKKKEFWKNAILLKRVEGRVASIGGPEKGFISVIGDMKAFFVPGRGDIALGRSENQRVDFILGFSYEGLRAWEVKRL